MRTEGEVRKRPGLYKVLVVDLVSFGAYLVVYSVVGRMTQGRESMVKVKPRVQGIYLEWGLNPCGHFSIGSSSVIGTQTQGKDASEGNNNNCIDSCLVTLGFGEIGYDLTAQK